MTAVCSYILSQQRPDGSWEGVNTSIPFECDIDLTAGMWGVCFTYGAWFAIEGLVDAGLPITCVHVADLHHHRIHVCIRAGTLL